MPYFHEFDYIFAFGVIFAFLDAWNIGKYISISYHFFLARQLDNSTALILDNW